MRLLHHFTSCTSATLSDHPEAQEVWSTTVVQIAFGHPFLLHGILALAALYMANSNSPEKEQLSITAASKQDAAIREFRSQLEEITRHNCDAVFAFSFLAVYYIPASAGTVINPSATFIEDDFFGSIVEWLRLHRGTSDIYRRKGHWIRKGPLAPLLWKEVLHGASDLPVQINDILNASLAQSLLNLENLLKTEITDSEYFQKDRLTNRIDENEINLRAFKILVEAFSRVSIESAVSEDMMAVNQLLESSEPSSRSSRGRLEISYCLSLSFAWLFEIPAEFLELLEQQRPGALIIFAHFSLLFQNAPKFWWNEPIPAKIVKAVTAVLPRKYHEWIQWPICEVLDVQIPP
jgi:hypothetical protein